MFTILKKISVRFCIFVLFFFQTFVATLAAKSPEPLMSDTVKFEVMSDFPLPADISFFFADIKFTGEELKICDLGGIFTGGRNTGVMDDGTKDVIEFSYWDLFWHYLSRFNKPLWYVGDYKESALKKLSTLGGKPFLTLEDFLHYYDTEIFSQEKSLIGMQEAKGSIGTHKGILVVRKRPLSKKRFLRHYPDILLVNARTKKFTGKREAIIHLKEQSPELQRLMPTWKVYEKKYTSDLAAQLYTEIPADFYIVKPMHGILSNGVFMVARENLDLYLKLILEKPTKIDEKEYPDLEYWKTDRYGSFLVQAYAPSKTIVVKGKKYDPTMRVIFFMNYDQKIISVNVVAGFWKIPQKSLDDEALLSHKHITRPFSGSAFTGIPIDKRDFDVVKERLNHVLPPIYLKMLEYTGK